MDHNNQDSSISMIQYIPYLQITLIAAVANHNVGTVTASQKPVSMAYLNSTEGISFVGQE